MVYFSNSRVPVECFKIARDLGVGACEKPSGVKGLMLSVMWHLKESQANIRRVNENLPDTPCTQSRVRPSFIHPFTEEAT